MARYYIRGDKGRFAGSTGGSGGFVGGRRSRGGGGTVYRGRRKGFTPAAASAPRGANGRIYVQQAGRYQRTVAVTRIKNRKFTYPPDSLATRRAIGGRSGRMGNTRWKVGSPIGGNSNMRYVSRASVAARTVTPPTSRARIYTRAYSSGVRRTTIERGRLPRSGYVVAYGPRTKVSN